MSSRTMKSEPASLIERLTMILAALMAQAQAAVGEITDVDVRAVITLRQLQRVAGYVADAIVQTKTGNDTLDARAKVIRQLLTILRQLESDERRMLDTRRAASAQIELSVTSAAIAQVIALCGDGTTEVAA